MEKVVFDDLQTGLQQAKSTMRAAEAHGVLCGLLSAGGAVSHKDWLSLLLNDWDEQNLLTKELITKLSILHITTLQDLNDSNLSFYLFLPNDDSAIKDRVVALSDWCEGFLYGFGLHIKEAVLAKHEPIREAIQDIQEIGRVNVDEADESDFVEVTEYIRMAILMIYDTLQPVKRVSSQIQ